LQGSNSWKDKNHAIHDTEEGEIVLSAVVGYIGAVESNPARGGDRVGIITVDVRRRRR